MGHPRSARRRLARLRRRPAAEAPRADALIALLADARLADALAAARAAAALARPQTLAAAAARACLVMAWRLGVAPRPDASGWGEWLAPPWAALCGATRVRPPPAGPTQYTAVCTMLDEAGPLESFAAPEPVFPAFPGACWALVPDAAGADEVDAARAAALADRGFRELRGDPLGVWVCPVVRAADAAALRPDPRLRGRQPADGPPAQRPEPAAPPARRAKAAGFITVAVAAPGTHCVVYCVGTVAVAAPDNCVVAAAPDNCVVAAAPDNCAVAAAPDNCVVAAAHRAGTLAVAAPVATPTPGRRAAPRAIAWRVIAPRAIAWRVIAWRVIAWRVIAWRVMLWRIERRRPAIWPAAHYVGLPPSAVGPPRTALGPQR